MLSLQDPGNPGTKPAQIFILGIHQVPFPAMTVSAFKHKSAFFHRALLISFFKGLSTIL
jgi:hypothetical protein